jgi:hypothetical protein
MAPATADVREPAETLIMSMGSLLTIPNVLVFASSVLHNSEVLLFHPAKLDNYSDEIV